MKKLLWVGDAGVPSGFAKATHAILETLRHEYEVTVLGMNYQGDPHQFPYEIYAAAPGGDTFGIGRLIFMCDKVQPDMIVIQQDGWNIPYYTKQLKRFPEHANIPVVGAIAVDGKNFQGQWLDGLSLAIFWTEFARNEAEQGGWKGPSAVIPLGVDLNLFQPRDKHDARSRKLPKELDDAFIVGNVNRNQHRKRLDLTIKYFAEWVKQFSIDDAYLYLHIAPTGDTGSDVRQLARYYGIGHRLATAEPMTFYGDTEDQMVDTFNCFDVQVSTTQGEGFGLTTFEGMACGVPQIVPDWSALGELCKDASLLVPCTSTAIGPPYENVIGGVADEEQFITTLQSIYDKEPSARSMVSYLGTKRVSEDRFRWENIGQRYLDVLREVVC